MNNLKIDFFEMQMNSLGVYIKNLNKNAKIPDNKEVKDRYYETFKNLSNIRFAKIIKWVYENHGTDSYITFPSIADFKKAFEQTSEAPSGNYIPPKREEQVNKFNQSAALRIIQRDMDLMNVLERAVYLKETGKRVDVDTSRANTLKYYIPFIKDKFKNNMAYHIKNKTWQKFNTDMKRSEWFIVRNYYPPNHVFITG